MSSSVTVKVRADQALGVAVVGPVIFVRPIRRALACVSPHSRPCRRGPLRLVLGRGDGGAVAVEPLLHDAALPPRLVRQLTFVAAWSLLAQSRAWLVRGYFEHDTLPAWVAVQHTQALAQGTLEAALAAGYPLGARTFIEGQMAAALAIRGERDATVRLAEAADRRNAIAQNAVEGIYAWGGTGTTTQ